MKKFLFFVLAIAITVSNTTPTNARPTDRIYSLAGTTVKISAVENAKAVTVSMSGIQNDVVKITLEAANGDVFYEEEVTKMLHYSKKFMLADLETGTYQLVVRKNFTKTIQPFVLTENGVNLNSAELTEKLLPVVKQKGSTVDVNYLSSSPGKVIVSIFDNEGKLVFEDVKSGVTSFAKRYDLSKLFGGVYFMEVSAGGEIQYATLNL